MAIRIGKFIWEFILKIFILPYCQWKVHWMDIWSSTFIFIFSKVNLFCWFFVCKSFFKKIFERKNKISTNETDCDEMFWPISFGFLSNIFCSLLCFVWANKSTKFKWFVMNCLNSFPSHCFLLVKSA